MLVTPNIIPSAASRFIQQIAIINQSTLVDDGLVRAVVHAIQVQVSRDFCPAWNLIAELVVYPKMVTPPAWAWQMVLLDDADQAGALGYHELTAIGQPLGKVFVRTTSQDGVAWSTTLSHEILEMIADPYTDECSLVQDNTGASKIYALEVCDPVENDSYVIGDFLVSNFVLPEWFENETPNYQKNYDFLGNLTAPFTMTAGGYYALVNVTTPVSWTQVTAEGKQRTFSKRPCKVLKEHGKNS